MFIAMEMYTHGASPERDVLRRPLGYKRSAPSGAIAGTFCRKLPNKAKLELETTFTLVVPCRAIS